MTESIKKHALASKKRSADDDGLSNDKNYLVENVEKKPICDVRKCVDTSIFDAADDEFISEDGEEQGKMTALEFLSTKTRKL